MFIQLGDGSISYSLGNLFMLLYLLHQISNKKWIAFYLCILCFYVFITIKYKNKRWNNIFQTMHWYTHIKVISGGRFLHMEAEISRLNMHQVSCFLEHRAIISTISGVYIIYVREGSEKNNLDLGTMYMQIKIINNKIWVM